jgi:hypothetical protein
LRSDKVRVAKSANRNELFKNKEGKKAGKEGSEAFLRSSSKTLHSRVLK